MSSLSLINVVVFWRLDPIIIHNQHDCIITSLNTHIVIQINLVFSLIESHGHLSYQFYHYQAILLSSNITIQSIKSDKMCYHACKPIFLYSLNSMEECLRSSNTKLRRNTRSQLPFAMQAEITRPIFLGYSVDTFTWSDWFTPSSSKLRFAAKKRWFVLSNSKVMAQRFTGTLLSLAAIACCSVMAQDGMYLCMHRVEIEWATKKWTLYASRCARDYYSTIARDICSCRQT